MTDPIHIDPEVMRTVANQHDDVADQIAPAREASAASPAPTAIMPRDSAA